MMMQVPRFEVRWCRRNILIAVCLTIAMMTGCAMQVPPVAERSTITPQSDVVIGAFADREFGAPDPIASADAAVTAAWESNPELRQMYARFEAAMQETAKASALPDPQLTYTQFIESVQTRAGEQEAIVGLSQRFPWFGVLRGRSRLAEAMALEMLEQYRVLMLDVERDVRQAWHDRAHTAKAREIREEERDLLKQMLDAASTAYASGQARRLGVLKMQTELARVESALEMYPAKIAGLDARLRNLVGKPVVLGDPVLEQDALAKALPERETLISQAQAARPELAMVERQTEQARIREDLARRNYYPEFMAGANYFVIGDRPDNPAMPPPDEGEDAWNVMLGVTIPMPHAGRRAGVTQARKQLEAARAARQQVLDRIEREIDTALPELRRVRRQCEILSTTVLPLAEETWQTSRFEYEAGRGSYLDLLEAQRTMLDVREDLLMLEHEAHTQWVNLERAVGGNLMMEQNGVQNHE